MGGLLLPLVQLLICILQLVVGMFPEGSYHDKNTYVVCIAE